MSPRSDKKKLLIITQSFIKYRGDILSKHIFVAAKLLTKVGWEVSVLAPHESKLAYRAEIDGVKVFRFKYFFERYERLAYSGRMQELVTRNPINLLIFLFFVFFFLLRAIQIARRTRPTVIHAHWWIPTGMLGCLVSRLTNTPLLVTLHGTDVRLANEKPLLSSLAKRVFRCVTRIQVVSNFIKEQLVANLEVPPGKISVFPMPIDTEKIHRKEVTPHERGMILCVARLTKQKNLATLIRAFQRVHQNWSEHDLMIVGEGPEETDLLEMIGRLHLENRVLITGLIRQEILNEAYNWCDLCVLPSLDEGFGLQLVEAQLCKKPVIGARSGGIPDIIEDGKTGLLFPPEDHQGLASAIERVLSDESLASRLAEAGYRSAIANFSQEAFLKRYVEALKWTQRRF